MAKQRKQDDGGVATLPPPEQASPLSAGDALEMSPEQEPVPHPPQPPKAEPIPGACIGLPVQYHSLTETLPATLQRQTITDPSVWDLKVSIAGAAVPVLRPSVKFATTPKPGTWTFLPGW